LSALRHTHNTSLSPPRRGGGPPPTRRRLVRLTTSLPPMNRLPRKCGFLDLSQSCGASTACYGDNFTCLLNMLSFQKHSGYNERFSCLCPIRHSIAAGVMRTAYIIQINRSLSGRRIRQFFFNQRLNVAFM
jgi:hypothetical protein